MLFPRLRTWLTRSRSPLRRPLFIPRLDALEDRTAPALFTVTSAADDLTTPGTLRQAVAMSNLTPEANTIHFSIGGGPQVISLDPTLPALNLAQRVTLDATTQGGSVGAPIVTLQGRQ